MSKDSDTKIKRIYSKNIESKRNTRIFSVQMLYSYIMQHTPDNLSLMLHDAFNTIAITSPIDQKYAVNIVIGVTSHIVELEQEIQIYLANDWRFPRLGKVVQAVLLVAAYEILFTKELSPSIIINEYLEIAKLLNHEGEVGFINSVLDNIAKHIR